MKKIVFTGGGTAGHVYPCLAIIEELDPKEYEIHYIGGHGMEKDIIKKEKNIIYHEIDPIKLERKLTLKNFLIPIKLFKSILQAKKILKEIDPCIIFSKGGFVAVPVVVAGAKLKKNVISHESDLSMGLANKIILKFCNKMCVSFDKTARGNKKIIYTGQPIRKKVLNGRKTNLTFFNKLNKSKPTLLVLGGSSGAKFINEKIWENLEWLCEKYNVVHVTGKRCEQKYNHQNYFQVDYAENIGDYLDCAEIVVSRAGSGAINEFLALKKPMLLIPLSKKCSRGDQIENAKLFKEYGYAEMIEEEEFNNNLFMEKLEDLTKNIKNYQKNMQKNAKNDANKKIIAVIKENEKEE